MSSFQEAETKCEIGVIGKTKEDVAQMEKLWKKYIFNNAAKNPVWGKVPLCLCGSDWSYDLFVLCYCHLIIMPGFMSQKFVPNCILSHYTLSIIKAG